ncbi:MAG TPA: ATP-dependent protease subunit HslV [Clostridiales bacterium]|nr:ATP-dependent protease subunit HslV [Clostridiales bacterium]
MLKGTTIVAVRRDGMGAVAGDGQVTLGQFTIMKHGARKVRRLYNDRVVIGFAGSVADSFTLSERLEAKLEEYAGNLQRAAVELAREWRSDKVLQKLEAMLVAMDKDNLLVISGTGEVIEPDDDVAAIGSGGMYAMAAAKALLYHTEMNPAEIVEEALKIASSICVYTNENIHVEKV